MIDQLNLNHSYTTRLEAKHTSRSQTYFYKASRAAIRQVIASASDDIPSSEADIL
jgi:hypothetical protein